MCIMYDRIKELCDNRKVSMTAMCRAVGLSPNVMSELKSGRTKSLSIKNAIKIADYFGVTTAYLIGENDNKTLINDVQFNNDNHPNENILRIAGRDGRQIEKRLTDEQVKALEAIINQLPDAPDDL